MLFDVAGLTEFNVACFFFNLITSAGLLHFIDFPHQNLPSFFSRVDFEVFLLFHIISI